ncbi:insoluble matrix shell protein 5-like [Haliotis cracherodii]|uniref:insoluble matrix shell protein 5-like n=1 Tax=Haliotis cracherodii TaxID=6455 RepID=UPI0039E791B8
MLTLAIFASFLAVGLCYPSGHVGDSKEARRLFRISDKDGDNILTQAEFHAIFLEFDLDSDHNITSNEFVTDWAIKDLGPPSEAIVLFHNIDVNKDGVITEDVDLPYIFHYFDQDENKSVSEAEFVVQWVKMSVS